MKDRMKDYAVFSFDLVRSFLLVTGTLFVAGFLHGIFGGSAVSPTIWEYGGLILLFTIASGIYRLHMVVNRMLTELRRLTQSHR